MADKKKKRKRKEVFHAPRTIGERTELKMTKGLIALSIVSLAVQLGLSIFGITAYSVLAPTAELVNGINPALLLLALPAGMWALTIAARVAFRFLPLDMWRMPIDVRAGMVKCDGWLLKLVTLLVELETALVFFYVDIMLFLGLSPGNAAMILWLAALAVTIYLPCRRAGKLGRGEIAWPGAEEPR